MVRAEDNTVEPIRQLPPGIVIGEGEGRPRVLFIGNSITLHGPKADIGWSGNWGMAASAPENDYVHLTMRSLRRENPEASYRIAQLADWEREYWRGPEVLDRYRAAVDWEADIIVVRLGENVPESALTKYPFAPAFDEMLSFFNPGRAAREVITSLFWRSQAKEDAIRQVAEVRCAKYLSITHLGDDDAMMAIGLFEHRGVAMHPGDAGMRAIAEVILGTL